MFMISDYIKVFIIFELINFKVNVYIDKRMNFCNCTNKYSYLLSIIELVWNLMYVRYD